MITFNYEVLDKESTTFASVSTIFPYSPPHHRSTSSHNTSFNLPSSFPTPFLIIADSSILKMQYNPPYSQINVISVKTSYTLHFISNIELCYIYNMNLRINGFSYAQKNYSAKINWSSIVVITSLIKSSSTFVKNT